MLAAGTMADFGGRRGEALPHGRLREVLKKYNRLGP
jgi:hypothetical protein